MEEVQTTNELPVETIKERVVYIIRQLNLSVAKFERLVGWSVGYVSTIKESFKLKKANQIKKVFKNVNINFIMKGKGQPFKEVKDDPRTLSEQTYSGRFKKMLAQLHDKGIIRNQTDLAKQLGYNSTYLSVIANHKEKVPANFIEKLHTLDSTIDGAWLLNDPEGAQPAEIKDAQQSVLDAVNALPDTNEQPAEEKKSRRKSKAEPKEKKDKKKGKPGRKPKADAKAEAAAEAPVAPAQEPAAEAAPEKKRKGGRPAKKEEAKPVTPEHPAAPKPFQHMDAIIAHNGMLIEEIKKQGERMDVLLDIIKKKF
ncbi:MAG: hypothetical protein J6V76_05465 [Bacteroidales bacterium]|nr:hypothetical protein [Bacteroidales bacterium]